MVSEAITAVGHKFSQYFSQLKLHPVRVGTGLLLHNLLSGDKNPLF